MDGNVKRLLRAFLLLKVLSKDGGVAAPAPSTPTAGDPAPAEPSQSTVENVTNIRWFGTISQPKKKKKKKQQDFLKTEEDAASELRKSLTKRHLENIGYFEKADWRSSYLQKDAEQPTVLYHYSRQPGLKSIDPKQMGTGTRGDFNRRFNPSQIPDFPHTSFHYIKDEPEDIVRGGSRSKYTLKLEPHQKLYDLSTDKDKLVHQAIQENQGVWNYENVLNKIKNAGYYGTWASQSEHPVIANTVQLFHQHPIHTEEGV